MIGIVFQVTIKIVVVSTVTQLLVISSIRTAAAVHANWTKVGQNKVEILKLCAVVVHFLSHIDSIKPTILNDYLSNWKLANVVVVGHF